MILVKKAGQPTPKLEQFASENVKYTFDLTELLDPIELAVKVNPSEYDGLTFTNCRSLGTKIEIRIQSMTLDTSLYKDYSIQIPYTTSMNNTRILMFALRVHK